MHLLDMVGFRRVLAATCEGKSGPCHILEKPRNLKEDADPKYLHKQNEN
jgi:hypothetical protein